MYPLRLYPSPSRYNVPLSFSFETISASDGYFGNAVALICVEGDYMKNIDLDDLQVRKYYHFDSARGVHQTRKQAR